MSAAKTGGDSEPLTVPPEEVAQALDWHDGDAEATIRTLLADCKHLREQLALAEISLSLGYTRGWRSTPDRANGAV